MLSCRLRLGREGSVQMHHAEARFCLGCHSDSQETFMRKPVFVCLVMSVAVLLFSSVAWSQATNTGTVVGVVTDQSNAVVPSANVILTDPSTGTSQTASTSENGRYIFVNVKPGTY